MALNLNSLVDFLSHLVAQDRLTFEDPIKRIWCHEDRRIWLKIPTLPCVFIISRDVFWAFIIGLFEDSAWAIDPTEEDTAL